MYFHQQIHTFPSVRNHRIPQRRLECLLAIVIVVTASLIGARELTAADLPPRPNIILCMADDQGWGDVGYYGSSPVQTPVLDEMAATGLRFDRFYAAAPVCSPTRGSVLTGRHPNRFGCFSWGYSLRPQEVTLAEALQKAGYATGHFGKWHLGSTYADSPVSPGHSGFDQWLSSPNFYENDPLMSWNGKVIQTRGESSRVPVDYALDFMKSAVGQEKPFLAVIWFGSPHQPHIATDELRALYTDQTKRQQDFLGEITGIDRAVGHLRQTLKELGLAQTTMLWYTSDNGALPVGSTNGLRGKKGDLYEGGLRVPAIIEWPGVITQPRIITDVAGTVDIYPTVLELAGATVDPQPVLDGQSLVPLLKGEKSVPELGRGFWVYTKKGIGTPSQKFLEEQLAYQKAGDFSDRHPEYETGQLDDSIDRDNPPGHAAWIEGNWKLHRLPSADDQFTYVLYDLQNDPAETTDVAQDHPEQVQKMRDALAGWQRSVAGSLAGEDYSGE